MEGRKQQAECPEHTPTSVTDMVREGTGNYLVAVEELEESHAALVEALAAGEQRICELTAKLYPLKEEALLQLTFDEKYNRVLAALVAERSG